MLLFTQILQYSVFIVKIVASGEGGAALTNNAELDQKMKLLRSHGITRDYDQMESPTDDAWYYEQIDLGFNYRMTDIHAALGLAQMERLESYIQKRHEIAAIYDQAFAETEVTTPFRNPENVSALHLYVILIDELKHKEIFHSLRKMKIGVNLHYIPVHTQPYYRKLGFNWGDFPNSEAYSRRAISLPIYPTLERNEQAYVIDKIKDLCDE